MILQSKRAVVNLADLKRPTENFRQILSKNETKLFETLSKNPSKIKTDTIFKHHQRIMPHALLKSRVHACRGGYWKMVI